MRIENAVYDFGSIYYEEGKTIDWGFVFNSLENYHYTNTGCYCTQLTGVDLSKNYISGTLNLSQAMGDSQKGKSGEYPVEKNITVFFDPSVHEYVADEKGKRISNPEKESIYLTIRGFVRVLKK
jgi:hypothetical protein